MTQCNDNNYRAIQKSQYELQLIRGKMIKGVVNKPE